MEKVFRHWGVSFTTRVTVEHHALSGAQELRRPVADLWGGCPSAIGLAAGDLMGDLHNN
jgi:hypothetical protein